MTWYSILWKWTWISSQCILQTLGHPPPCKKKVLKKKYNWYAKRREGFRCGSVGKEFSCNAGHFGSIPGLGRSPGEGKGYPLQYFGLKNTMNCPWGFSVKFSSVQSLSRVQLFVTPWIAARQASLSITNSQSSLRLTSIESVMPSSHLILCRPLLLLPPIMKSQVVKSSGP